MKRFWKDVTKRSIEGGWTVELDERPVKTPARASLAVPTETLAEEIANEWRSIGETIDPSAMPLTGLANAAIDRVAPDREAFAEDLARYAEADLFCYRADSPQALIARQADSWDSFLAWARRRFDIDFAVTSGIVHVAQPPATVAKLGQAVAQLDAFRLAAMSPLVTIGGSLVGALAVLEKYQAPEAAWEAVSIDERWQLEQWGADAEAEVALANRRRDFMAAARFLALMD